MKKIIVLKESEMRLKPDFESMGFDVHKDAPVPTSQGLNRGNWESQFDLEFGLGERKEHSIAGWTRLRAQYIKGFIRKLLASVDIENANNGGGE